MKYCIIKNIIKELKNHSFLKLVFVPYVLNTNDLNNFLKSE